MPGGLIVVVSVLPDRRLIAWLVITLPNTSSAREFTLLSLVSTDMLASWGGGVAGGGVVGQGAAMAIGFEAGKSVRFFICPSPYRPPCERLYGKEVVVDGIAARPSVTNSIAKPEASTGRWESLSEEVLSWLPPQPNLRMAGFFS